MFLRRKVYLLLFFALIAGLCFASGFISCLHLKKTSTDSSREQNLAQPGSTPPAVRSAILEKVRELQDGYTLREPSRLASVSRDLFPADGDLLILGTNGGVDEWVRGASNASRFIAADWRGWGDVRLDVEHAIVWSSGDVAWLATIGDVRWHKSQRPLRFTAVLTREDKGWVFRQMHFQWDDNDPAKGDLLRPRTYLRLFSDVLR